jgi:hypothetical protein
VAVGNKFYRASCAFRGGRQDTGSQQLVYPPIITRNSVLNGRSVRYA